MSADGNENSCDAVIASPELGLDKIDSSDSFNQDFASCKEAIESLDEPESQCDVVADPENPENPDQYDNISENSLQFNNENGDEVEEHFDQCENSMDNHNENDATMEDPLLSRSDAAKNDDNSVSSNVIDLDLDEVSLDNPEMLESTEKDLLLDNKDPKDSNADDQPPETSNAPETVERIDDESDERTESNNVANVVDSLVNSVSTSEQDSKVPQNGHGDQKGSENMEETVENLVTGSEKSVSDGNRPETGITINETIVIDDSDDIVELPQDKENSKPSGLESDEVLLNSPDDESPKITEKDKEAEDMDDDDDNKPMIRVRMEGIFEEQEEDDEVEEVEPDLIDVQSMMQMSFHEGDDDDEVQEVEAEADSPRRQPRRAAAAAAANTIREISQGERQTDRAFGRRLTSRDEDSTFSLTTQPASSGSGPRGIQTIQSQSGQLKKCHVCKGWEKCEVKLQRNGRELYICTNECFKRLRSDNHILNQNGKLPCAKCGTVTRSYQDQYYWETMNFCSELCVGYCQVELGGKCVTCARSVPWLSLGKYCVRFGSDVRQFCTAGCLEVYKKGARVCFHCQLDIKRLGNVILANIPTKTSPKEFCSQDCVEMYVEQNLNQVVRSRANQVYTCVICSILKPCYKELVLSESGLRVCSEFCWNRLIETKRIANPVKCDTCTKFIILECGYEAPAHCLSTEQKVYGFCSATCKNVFVLKYRQILACVTCKVKKYNYDLIQSFVTGSFSFAVCSLNCLPVAPEHITTLKDSICPPSSASQLLARTNQPQIEDTEDNCSVPVISSVSSIRSITDPSANFGVGLGTTADVGVGADNIEYLELDPSQADNIEIRTTDDHFDVFEDEIARTMADWDGVITAADIEELLKMHWRIPKMKTRWTMAKPKVCTVETQTDESVLTSMDRIPLKEVEIVKFIPVPIPCPIYLPTPAYLMETPIPYPFPLPIPIPVPIPIVLNGNLSNSDIFNTNMEISSSLPVVPAESNSDKEVDTVDDDSNLPIRIEQTDSDNTVEMMDCSSSDAVMNTNDDGNVAPAPVTFEPTVVSPTNINSEVASSSLSRNSLSAVSTLNSSISGAQEGTSSPGKKKEVTRVEYGIRAWKMSFGPMVDPLQYNVPELASKLTEWVNKGTKPNGEKYRADIFIYLCLGVQQYLTDNNRVNSIFYDSDFGPFVEAITNYAEADCAQGINTRIEDAHFWESKQLGSSSPGVLLFSLIYFLYKNFHLKTWEQHAALHFGQIKIVERMEYGKTIKKLTIVDTPDCENIEVSEREDSEERCLVKLVQLYMSKCEQLDGPFYKAMKIKPHYEQGGSWYSGESLDQMQIYQMLVRAMMIKADSDLK